VAAGRAGGHIDRRPAVGAVHAPNVSAQLVDLLRRERADEVLFAEKVEKRRQPAVRMRAAQILEPGGPLNVVRPAEPGPRR
jgi:hypothetical protein